MTSGCAAKRMRCEEWGDGHRAAHVQVDMADDPSSPVPLDPEWPNGSFTFHLGNPEHRAAAAGLAGIAAAHGADAFARAHLNGAALHAPAHAAFASLPEHGTLQVRRTHACTLPRAHRHCDALPPPASHLIVV